MTELEDEIGDFIQGKGKEFGATTGRRRRCGWLDLVVVGDSVRLNGLNSMAITKLDVLSGLETLKICVAYEINGQRVHQRPASLGKTALCKPVYKEMPGWKEDITGAREKNDLPTAALDYLSAIEDITGVPVSIISVGPGRNDTIMVKKPGS